jgi:hypothetical protein
MAIAGMPRPIAEPNIANFSKEETAPLTARWQPFAVIAAELIGQCFFVPLRMAEDDRAKLARMAVVDAEDLLATRYCAGE